MKNIEPNIQRQRLIIEAHYGIVITRETVKNYLLELAKVLDMKLHLPEPIITSATGVSKPIHDGFEGVVFWVESGAVIYTWERINFLTIDMYSCKYFETEKAIAFTNEYFQLKDTETESIVL